jgi:hypothetical protein
MSKIILSCPLCPGLPNGQVLSGFQTGTPDYWNIRKVKQLRAAETATVRNFTFELFLIGEAKEVSIVKNSYGTDVH